MHFLNMDQHTWYNCKEMYNTHFTPYYNSMYVTNNGPYYQYNKNMMSYIDQESGFITQPYSSTLPAQSESVPEIETKNNSSEAVEKKEIQSLEKKKGSKSTHNKKSYSNKKGKKFIKNHDPPLLQLKPASCRGQLKHSECDEVSDGDRYLIYKEFHNLSSNQAKWQFIASHVHVYAKNRSTSKALSRRENTHQYFLTVGGHKVRVCRRLFLSTLCISEAVIRTSLEKLSPHGICENDNRGRKPPPNKLSATDDAFIRHHILSFAPSDTGQCRWKNSKIYLDSNLSISSMHKMYINICKDLNRRYVSVETYRKISKEYNICFAKVQKEVIKRLDNPQLQGNIENRKILNPLDKSNDTIFEFHQKPNGETISTHNNFTSHINPMDGQGAIDNSEQSSGYFPSFEDRQLSLIEPQTSFDEDDVPADNCPHNTVNVSSSSVIEIGMMSQSKEGDQQQNLSIPSKEYLQRNEKLTKGTSKLKRLRGESYIDSKGIFHPARPMKNAPCRNQYKHSLCDTISDNERELIYTEFRNLDSSQAQWQFIASHIYVHAKSKSTSKGPSRRENTHHYYLTTSGHKVKVCRRFFLATLNVSEAVIRTALEKLSPQGICQEDARGHKPPPNKLSLDDEKFLTDHILSFCSVDSSLYGKKNKKYLNSTLSYSLMHKMYINVCKEHNRKFVSLEMYRRICKEYSIAFIKPSKDSSKNFLFSSSLGQEKNCPFSCPGK